MILCPKCGSTNVCIDGVQQGSKGVLYYLTGTNIRDAGTRHAAKLGNAIKGNKLNAECRACGFAWSTKNPPEKAVPPVTAAPASVPAPKSRERFCHHCGTKAEEGDLFCIECGTKLRS